MRQSGPGLEIGNGTDVGCVREHNEDSFACLIPENGRQAREKGYLLAVCDGMGGAVGGKTASSIAIETIPEVYYNHGSRGSAELLAAAIEEANRRIYSRAEKEPELQGMGTTAVAVAVVGDEVYLAHVGDSRCYLIREGAITLLTNDHTMVNKMVAEGLLTEEQARNHPEGHILSRSVGVAAKIEVDVHEPFRLIPGDALLLCSDGLTNQVEDDEILETVGDATPQEAAEQLISLAKERGGPDNITVQIIKSVDGKPQHHESSVTSTIRTRVPKSGNRMRGWLLLLLLLALTAAVIYFLWLYEVVDFQSLLSWDWIPPPPQYLPPFK